MVTYRSWYSSFVSDIIKFYICSRIQAKYSQDFLHNFAHVKLNLVLIKENKKNPILFLSHGPEVPPFQPLIDILSQSCVRLFPSHCPLLLITITQHSNLNSNHTSPMKYNIMSISNEIKWNWAWFPVMLPSSIEHTL